MLNGEQNRELFTLRDEHRGAEARNRSQARLYVVGGAVMALAFAARPSARTTTKPCSRRMRSLGEQRVRASLVKPTST